MSNIWEVLITCGMAIILFYTINIIMRVMKKVDVLNAIDQLGDITNVEVYPKYFCKLFHAVYDRHPNPDEVIQISKFIDDIEACVDGSEVSYDRIKAIMDKMNCITSSEPGYITFSEIFMFKNNI